MRATNKLKSKIYRASNGRSYIITASSTLPYYVWVRFLDNDKEALIIHATDTPVISKNNTGIKGRK